MSNYVLKYKRGDEVKYISHLDFIRFMQRVLRRAGIRMEFSSGFNPHPIMSVALPLSVGVTADKELMRIGLLDDFDENELKKIINNSLVDGFEIIDVKKTEGKEFDFNKINRAEYICCCQTQDTADINKFLANEKILVMKKSKSGIKEDDIKPHIHSLEIIESDENSLTLKMCLDAGNNYNLKPDLVLEALKKYDENFDVEFYSVKRSRLLCNNSEIF